jgi:hypothetical protein
MKTTSSNLKMFLPAMALAFVIVSGAAGRVQAQTNFTVTTPGSQFAFVVNGTNDNPSSPTLNLHAGATYTFQIMTSPGFHPVDFVTNTSAPFLNNAYSGASAQDVDTATVTLTIPSTGFPSTLFYICNIHGFFGTINVLPPAVVPPPPRNNIISIVVSPTFVTVKSTGTNTTYALVPQFNSNLFTTNWTDVPTFTNVFASGTNTTTFNRLEPICGPNVFLRIAQRPPQ